MDSIAIVIPTIDRPHFLKRALDYYVKAKFKGWIYIGDSSRNDNTEKMVITYLEKLKIIYLKDPLAKHDGQVVQNLNKHILNNREIKHITYSGDDDFLVPSSLQKCAEFLEDNPPYVACHGHRLNFVLKENKPTFIGVRYGYDWDETTTPLQRWKEYTYVGIAIANYLHRKDIWFKRYEYQHETPSRYLGPEFLPESITALSGPVKYLTDCISYLFYQDNPERVFSFTNYSLYDLMGKMEWIESLETVTKVISKYLEPERVKQYLWMHFASISYYQYKNNYVDDIYSLNALGDNIQHFMIAREMDKIKGVFK
jgi:glycosyltransferase domain-containing protein